tara:strand:+ start:174 stop:557 length:384 start_codon:yes stop_codon:yes gene_type:complete
MKKESDLWKLLKKNTPQIRWTRLESWSSFGVCDCLGYHDHCGFFMVELKLIKNEKQKKVIFSPHQKLFHLLRPKRNFILLGTAVPRSIKLYGSKSIYGLLEDHRETPCLVQDDWDEVNRLLVNYKKN